jgi:MFS family permease
MVNGLNNSPKFNKSKQISLFPILLVNFIGTLGFSIVIPFLVFLVVRFGGNAIIYGIIGAFYPLFQFIGAPILGKWSDTYGRRKILLLSQIGTALSWLLFLIALFLPVSTILDVDSRYLGAFIITIPLVILFFARALDGITGGNISVANAYIADISTEDDRKKNYGKMAVSSNLGFIIGPALAGILGATIYGETLPVLAALIISVIAVITIILYLPESKTCLLKNEPGRNNIRRIFGQEQKRCYEVEGDDEIKFKDVVKLKHIPFMLVLYFLIFLGFNIFYTSFPIHAIEGLNWPIAKLGLFLAGLSLMMVIVQGPILSRLSKTTMDSTLILIGGVVLGLNFLLLISLNEILVYLAAVCFAIGNGLMWPSFLSLLSKFAGDKYQGSVQGIGGSAGAVASIIGLILGGFLYISLNSIAFLFSAIVIFGVTILSFRLVAIEKKRESEK